MKQDVTFDVQKFCPGFSDVVYPDNYTTVAMVEGMTKRVHSNVCTRLEYVHSAQPGLGQLLF